MKKFWSVETHGYNGTVTVFTETTLFATKELAEETAAAVERANAGGIVPVSCQVIETTLLESREEIPILNESEEFWRKCDEEAERANKESPKWEIVRFVKRRRKGEPVLEDMENSQVDKSVREPDEETYMRLLQKYNSK